MAPFSNDPKVKTPPRSNSAPVRRDPVAVTFKRGYHVWNKGETAGFSETEAKRLVEKLEVAVYANAPTEDDPPPAAELTLEHTGGGIYEIKRGDEVIDKVKGKESAEAGLAMLQAEA